MYASEAILPENKLPNMVTYLNKDKDKMKSVPIGPDGRPILDNNNGGLYPGNANNPKAKNLYPVDNGRYNYPPGMEPNNGLG